MSLSLARDRRAGPDNPEEAMNRHRWLATLLLILTLAACAQGGQVPYAPYSPENMHDRGGDGGGDKCKVVASGSAHTVSREIVLGWTL
jgi:hypothetical protein